MKILLLTRNHVVREFVELVAEKSGAKLDVIEGISASGEEYYDFFFVDDRGDLLKQGVELASSLGQCRSVLFYSELNDGHEHFDIKIKKPFLPSDIQSILEDDSYKKEYIPNDQILNIQDIEEIRGLLEDEGLEIVSEEDLVEDIDTKFKSKKREKMEQKLLAAIVKMKPKKIRELLKGAEVTLTIKFPGKR